MKSKLIKNALIFFLLSAVFTLHYFPFISSELDLTRFKQAEKRDLCNLVFFPQDFWIPVSLN